MLKKPLLPEWRYWPGIALLVLSLIAIGGVVSQQLPNTQEVVTKQQAKDAPSGEDAANPKVPTNYSDVASGSEVHGDDEGSEYWPSFFGLHLKITDSLLALFTFFLVGVGCIQGGLIRRQIKLARDEFLSSHRPKIRIKHVFLETEVWNTGLLKVEIHFVNSGNTNAILKSFRFDVLVTEDDGRLPRQAKKMAQNTIGIKGELPPGVNWKTPIPLDRSFTLKERFDQDIIMARNKKLFFVGAIVYAGVAAEKIKEQEHTTAFCRELCFNDPNKPTLEGTRFVPLEKPDSDYEYED